MLLIEQMLDWTKVLEQIEDSPQANLRIGATPVDRSLRELLVADRSAEPLRGSDDRLHPHLHGATLCLVWAFVLGLSALGLVWLYHMVAPERYCFLSDVQKSKLDLVLLTAITTLFVAERAQRLFKS